MAGKNKLASLDELPSPPVPGEVHLASLDELPAPTQNIGTGEAALLGGAQGLTFGLAPQIGAVAQTAGEALTSKDKIDSLLDLYRKHREANKQYFEQAQEQHPYAFTGGELASGLIPGYGLAKLLPAAKGLSLAKGLEGPINKATTSQNLFNAIKSGALAGGISGLAGPSDLTQGDIGGTIGDVAKGGLTGMAAGGVIGGVGVGAKALKSLSKDLAGSALVQDTASATGQGFKGNITTGKAGEEAARQAIEEAAISGGTDLGVAAKKAGELVGKEKESLVGDKDISKMLDIFENSKEGKVLRERAAAGDLDAKNDLAKLQNIIDANTKKTLEVPTEMRVPGEQQIIPAKPGTLTKLQDELTNKNLQAAERGEKPWEIIEREQNGEKYYALRRVHDEQIGAPERIVPVRDANGDIVDQELFAGESADKYKSNVDLSRFLKAEPSVPEQVVTGPEKVLSDIQKVELPRETTVPTKTAQLMKELFGEASFAGESPLQTNQGKALATALVKNEKSEIANISPTLDLANEKFSGLAKALKDLGLNLGDIEKTDSGFTLNPKAENKIKTFIRQLESGKEAGENKQTLFSDALEKIKEVEPALAEKLEPMFRDSSERLRLAKLSQNLNLYSPLKTLSGFGVQIGNRAGLVAKAVADATPEKVKNIAASVASKGGAGAQKVAEVISNTVNKDNMGRNATMFALDQYPEFRKILGSDKR